MSPTLLDRVLNRTARLRQHHWRTRAHRSPEAHIVVGGSPRSGTTLLRRMLDRHPLICCGPEMGLFLPTRFQVGPLAALSEIPAGELRLMLGRSHSQAAFVDAFALRYREVRSKERWAEKTPRNVREFGWISQRFPEARLVHLIRDGRDVICSAREHPDRRWEAGRWIWEHRPRPVERYARDWLIDTERGMRFRGHEMYHEMRYEDLALRPEDALRELCTFLEVGFDASLLRGEEPGPTAAATVAANAVETDSDAGPPANTNRAAVPAPVDRGPVFSSSVGRWRSDLVGPDLETVIRLCGPRLRELGYAT